MIIDSAPIQTIFNVSILMADDQCESESQKVSSADAYSSKRPKNIADDFKSILFMDDENTLRLVVKLMLERLGYKVTTSQNGQQTIDIYQNQAKLGHPFDVVILDINIEQGMGGIETFRRLIQIEPNIKAIGASGSVTPETLKSLLQVGFTRVLAKPFRLEQLKKALEETICT
ncbi:MAG: response regulator [Desulfobacteraceae bacterium]|jgi:CheY-like chemotaxis protein